MSSFGAGGQIVIPQIVMDRLEMPQPFSRAGIQRHDAVAEKILPDAVGPVEIVRRFRTE